MLNMERFSFLYLIFMVAVIPTACEFVHVQQSCQNDVSTSTVCFDNFTEALEYVHFHEFPSFGLNISEGSYSLTKSFTYIGLENITITTSYEPDDINGPVNISCNGEDTGLTFINCTNVEISDLSFMNCGAQHNSTTVTPGMKDYAKFNATIYFAFCHGELQLLRNVITQSKGIAVQLYSVSGKVTIESNNFTDNPYPVNSTNGGGLYIEFIDCSQLVNFDLCESHSTGQLGISEASYVINANRFINNIAINQFHSLSFTYPNNSNYISFGRGGGLSVCLRGSSTHNTFDIEGNTFINNQAVFGGGLLLEFRNRNASNNNINVNSCKFVNNAAKFAGGGVRLSLFSSWPASDREVFNNKIKFFNATYFKNSAEWGGGLSVEVSKEPQRHSLIDSITLTSSTWESNIGRLGAGMDITRSYNHPENTGILPNIILSKCKFLKNSVRYDKTVLGYGTLYADSVPLTFEDTIIFSNNDGAGIVTVDNTIKFTAGCQAFFCANRARDGAGITILAFSTLIIDRNTLLNFTGNQASNEGGAIFAFRAGGRNLKSSRDCFLRYTDPTKDPQKWKTKIMFDSNVASGVNNSIFTTSIDPCVWGKEKSMTKLRQQALCWNKTFSYLPVDCSHQITTDPASLIKTEAVLKVYPGIERNLSLFALNDQQGNVTRFLDVTVHSDSDQIVIDSRSKYISSNTILLRKSTTNSSKKCIDINETYSGALIVESNGPRVIIANLSIEFLSCPPGFVLQKTNEKSELCECKCADGEYYNLVHCENNEASILPGYWIGNTTHGSVKAGKCRYCNINDINSTYRIKLALTFDKTEELLCDKNRAGVLCGNCTNGSAPNFNSHITKCVKCEKAKFSTWLLFLFLRLIAPFTLFFMLFFMQFSVSSGYLNGPIFFAQMITTVFPIMGPLNTMVSATIRDILRIGFFSLYEIWNLNFCTTCFTTPCLRPNLSITDILLIDYGIAFLPLLLVLFFKFMDLLQYYKEKPFIVVITCNFVRSRLFRKLLTPKNAVRNALIAAIILSYNKIAVLTGYLLCPTPLYNENAGTGKDFFKNVQYVLYINGNISFMNAEHQKFAIPVILFSGIFLLLIPLLLLLYRYESIQKNDGFFNQLYKLFQAEFRSGARDNDSDDEENPLGQHSIQNPLFPSTETVAPEPFEYNLSIDCCCIKNYEDHISTTRRYKCWPPFFSFHAKVYHGSIRFHTAWGYNEYRWVPALYFYARLCFILTYMFAGSTMATIGLQAVLSLLIAGFFLVFRPYIKSIHNNIDGVIFLLMGVILLLELYKYYRSMLNLLNYRFILAIEDFLLMVPFLWITGYILYKIYKAYKKNKRGRQRQQNNNITVIDSENKPLLTAASRTDDQ